MRRQLSDETRVLLRASQAERKVRLTASDMLSTEEAAELAGTSPATVTAWIARGRCIGLAEPNRGYRLPKWQFEPSFLPLVLRLAEALGTAEGWALLAFLESANGGLNGLTPRVAIERGQLERVLEVARSEGYG